MQKEKPSKKIYLLKGITFTEQNTERIRAFFNQKVVINAKQFSFAVDYDGRNKKAETIHRFI